MRNLRILTYDETHLVKDGHLPLTATTWDVSDDSVICAFGPTPDKPVIELKRKSQSLVFEEDASGDRDVLLQSITSWDAPCYLPDLECDSITLIRHFADTRTTCIVLAGGDLVLVREDPSPDQEKIEIVGSIDVGLSAAAWSPDEEILAIVTRENVLLLMSRELEPLSEIQMTSSDLKMSKHVSVGWGKKETQFQGKRSKAMRDPTMPDVVDEGKASSLEDGRISISWRGDGAFVAINSFVEDHRRAIRVFTREGTLDSVSEPVDGLESALSWRPYGNLIAGIRRSGHIDAQEHVEVIFFERNGLRHGQFGLRLPRSELATVGKHIDLHWNNDSSILAVHLDGMMQLWTMSNYHYSLKQEIKLSESSPTSDRVSWHPEHPFACMLHSRTTVLRLEYGSTICRGPTVASSDYGCVAVIDGCTLKLTPFKHAGIPPPMSFCEVDAGSAIMDCAISRNSQKVAILTHHELVLCDWEMVQPPNIKISTTGALKHSSKLNMRKINLPSSTYLSQSTLFTQVIMQNDDSVYILARRSQHGSVEHSYAECRKLTWTTPFSDSVEAVFEDIRTPLSTQRIVTSVDRESAWTVDPNNVKMIGDDSQVFAIGVRKALMQHEIFAYSPSIMKTESNGCIEPSKHLATLSASGSLQIDDRVLARDCTSFMVTESYIIFTTSQHLLKFVHLTEPDKMDPPGDTPEVDERCRTIERGAKIVTVIPSIYAVILQMPRGNLETIYPRMLVLSGIRYHIQNLDYRAAFLACQSHQVDMNILFDYQPDTFLQNVAMFVEQLKKASRVDEFLSKLKEEDVTQTLYKDTLKGSEDTNTESKALMLERVKKVNTICDALINVFQDKQAKHFRSIITAHVCKRPPDLTAALTMVSSLRSTTSEEADVAISHLCFLTDTNRLYDAALSLYDLELALMVAQNAQRDPREYMPFLQSLQILPVLRRQYEIDNHLRNYVKALVSLHSLEAHDEVESYTVKHTLYTTAIDLYKYTPIYSSRITNLYAQYLTSLSQHTAAATLYESLQDHSSAYPLYALAHQWRESLTCAALVPLTEDGLSSLALSLATSCAEENRDYRSAATIYADYLTDYTGAARLLCKGSYFAEAGRILSLHKLQSELTNILDPGLTEKFGEIIALVADCKSQLHAQVPRIAELRKKKEEDPLAYYGGDTAAMAADGIDIPDNISLAATDASTVGGQSLFTRYGSNASKFGGTVASNASRKTSRTKRREERKRARGKKGSVYEEEYLVNSVARLLDRVNGIQDEVKRLMSGLTRRGMREQAAKVNEAMTDISQECLDAKKQVWLAKEQPEEAQGSYDVDGSGRPPGADGVFWDSQNEMNMAMKKEAPEVKIWSST